MARLAIPDWMIYGAALLALIVAADSRRVHADAPAAPPPVPGEESTPLSPLLSFDGSKIIRLAPDAPGRFATAFSVGDGGAWLTAAAAVRDCSRIAVVVAPGRAALATSRPQPGGALALLTTEGGSPALPLADAPARPGDDAFLVGFPQGGPGEAAVRLMGRTWRGDHRRGDRTEPALAWVEIGRTDGLNGQLLGLEGAPVLDGSGRVQGVLVGQAPQRGRLYAAPLAAVRQAVGPARSAAPEGDAVAADNYGRAADALRRDLRVAQVWCETARR